MKPMRFKDGYGRAIVSVTALYALFAVIEFLAMRDCGQMSRHARNSLRPGMTLAEVMRNTRGRIAAHADPESAPEGHGFGIDTYSIAPDGSGPRGVLYGLSKPDDLAAAMEAQMRKQPGAWVIYFEYRTLERHWNTWFTVTLGPDLRVREVSDVKRRREWAGAL